MSLNMACDTTIPEETARIAHAAFPKGTTWMALRDELGTLYDDAVFSHLFAVRGRPAQAPWRLALVTCFQFAENLSDRQAADAVRSRIDWKYALGLTLDDPGFDSSVLCEFRARLLVGRAETVLLERLLELCRERKWIKARGRQRTDSTHILACVRSLNRVENVAATLRHALDTVACVAPDWLRAQLQGPWRDWAQRYVRRLEEYQLPKTESARVEFATQIGRDGHALLTAVETDLAWLHDAPALATLRRVWMHQYYLDATRIVWRTDQTHGLPPSAVRAVSPHDAEARHSQKRDTVWEGYKVHLTETCDSDLPHLITHVLTTPATTPDVGVLPAVQQDLTVHNLTPDEHLVDSGYVEAETLVESARRNITLCGPPRSDSSWQARAGKGFAAADFQYDFTNRRATCPTGHVSHSWRDDGHDIDIKFSTRTCGPCPHRAQCTRTTRRILTVRSEAKFRALLAARDHLTTPEFKKRYAARAGIEGTLSQAVRRCALRRARYVGLAKTHLQNVFSAVAINLVRLTNWLSGVPLAGTRRSPFAKCCHSVLT